MSDHRPVAVVPMKPLGESKTRLRPHLNSSERWELSTSMLCWVLNALRDSTIPRTVVIGGDDRVATLTRTVGADWMMDRHGDLNLVVADALTALRRAGSSAMYVPADLPFLTPEDIDRAVEESSEGAFLTICPAHDGGTNGLIVPATVSFEPRLGPNSFRKHMDLAMSLGVEMRVVRSPGFDRDLDTIEDLQYCVDYQAPGLCGLSPRIEEPLS